MISLPLEPKYIEKEENKGLFEVHGLYPGYGVTVGNALRRVLLSSLEGVAVTEVKIKGVSHEFSTMSGVLEDVIMILLNIKNLRFQIHEGTTQKVELVSKGEGAVTGANFKKVPQVSLANPKQHIATITDKKTELSIELTLEKGIGYEPKDQRKNKKPEIGGMLMDAIFTPIKNVNFQVENMRVGDRTDFDKLSLEIETDGTLTPKEAFAEACGILLAHVNVIAGKGVPAIEASVEVAEEGGQEEKPARNASLARQSDGSLGGGHSDAGGDEKKSAKKKARK